MFPSFIKIKTGLKSEYGSNDAVLHPSYLFMKAQSKLKKNWTNHLKVTSYWKCQKTCAGYRNN